MGYFRFLLALLVAFSHIPKVYLPINLGVSAVVAFYFISGYLMAASYEGFQSKNVHPQWAFFVDRFIRIVPAYWLVFIVTIAIMTIVGREWMRWATIPEFLLLPFHITYMFGSTNVLLPTWSLSAELAFYLFVPLLAFLPSRCLVAVLLALIAGQFAVFTISGQVFQTLFAQDLDACRAMTTTTFCERSMADLLGYRWLPFSGTCFVLGTVVYRFQSLGFRIIAAFVAANFCMLIAGGGRGLLKNGYVDEQLWGAVLLVPMAWFAIGYMKKALDDPLDVLLGRMSYPLFLTHWAARYIVVAGAPRSVQGLGMIILAMLAAYLVMLFQLHIDRIRYSVRGFGKMNTLRSADRIPTETLPEQPARDPVLHPPLVSATANSTGSTVEALKES